MSPEIWPRWTFGWRNASSPSTSGAEHGDDLGGRDVLWLGPDEWLIVGEPGSETVVVEELERALADHHRSVVDVSANRILLDLEDALETLSAACGLDLDPLRWKPGMCAQTLFGQAQVILHQLDERTTRVFVRPSFAGYVQALLDASSSR